MIPNKYPIGTRVRVLSDKDTGIGSYNGTQSIWGYEGIITQLADGYSDRELDPDYHIDIDPASIDPARGSLPLKGWWVYESQIIPVDFFGDFDDISVSDLSLIM